MLSDEKDKLLALFETDGCWCQDAEARDAFGAPVKFHDPLATAWDLTGAMCTLFGWTRARALFGQFERHVHKRKRLAGFNRDAAIESMVILQSFNDRSDTTFAVIRNLLETMPVRYRVSRMTNYATSTRAIRHRGATV
jgi:hypothetical protein